MKFVKFSFIFFNPLTVSILLFVPLCNSSFGGEESVIPESNTTGGDSSGGENFGESIIPESNTTNGGNSGDGNFGESIIPESDITQGILISEDGTVTATPEIIARLDGIAASIIDDLNSGTIQIVDDNGATISVQIDTQQIIANILQQPSVAVSSESTIENISFNNNSSSVNVTPIEVVESIFGTLGEDTIFVSDDGFDVSITFVDSDNSLDLKSNKSTASESELITFRVKVVEKATKAITSRTLTGSQEQVKSAASAITALTLAGANQKTTDVAQAIALDTGIKPELLVKMMLDYEGLFKQNPSQQAINTITSPIKIASNSELTNVLLAQNKKSIVNIPKFAYSIEAYNQAVQESQPEVFQALNQNPEFQIIGQTLQRLRKSF
jgi:hypothetical protein